MNALVRTGYVVVAALPVFYLAGSLSRIQALRLGSVHSDVDGENMLMKKYIYWFMEIQG